MPLPLAHAFAGASLTAVAWPVKTPAGLRRGLAVGAVLGVCPDVDYVLNWSRIQGGGWHHGFTHSVLFALVAGIAASWGVGVRGWRGALVCTGAVLSHLLLDYVFTDSRGIALCWPVTDQRFKLGIPAWSYYRFAKGSPGWLGFGKLSAIELVGFGPIFAIAVWGSRRRYR
jgi:inner membrane protein